MLLLAFALAYSAMMLLCLAMPRHRGLLLPNTRLPSTPVIQCLAVGCFGFALWLCVYGQGGEVGTIVWLCLVMLSGVSLGLLLAWRSRWVLPLASLLVVCGGAQGLL
ncbi:hypothetical protein CH92_06150 [Stutzerimonas stutzeri]|uniref:DUF3325 domain-containing protein n=1 Tax=Stutzerimonas stutzeri TaxID=316 RepID=W8RRP5_STUST|nr:hypothetical protein CH92_06150 [Stutzerimonas stutzeri]